MLVCGCSNSEYRLQADREAYEVIEERNDDSRWQIADYEIEMDPRSRYFDRNNPDQSPMPNDDPAAHRYMHNVAGYEGWDHWHDNGERERLVNSGWYESLHEYVNLTEDGAVDLNIDSSLRLSYMHSPSHQRQLETLYLSALDVSRRRFELDTQYFGGAGTNFDAGGSLSGNTRSDLTLGRFGTGQGSQLFMKRRFATAGEFLAGFANSFAFEFSGGDTNFAMSLLNFTLTQPLLRGAGRDIALEGLTFDERKLLANLRAYGQFRQGFYTQVAIGELGVQGPQRGGIDTVMQSFSGSGSVGGYLGLLQTLQQIRYSEDNLALQQRTRDRLEALYENELTQLVQVDQFRQSIERTRAGLLDSRNGLELAKDNYKTGTLGLPSSLPVDLDDTLIEPFQLFPREADPILDSLLELQQRIGNVADLIELSDRRALLQIQLAQLPADQDVDSVDRTLNSLLVFAESMQRRLLRLEEDLAAAEAAMPPLTPEEKQFAQLIKQRLAENSESLNRLFRATRAKLKAASRGINAENREKTVDDIIASLTELLRLSQACLVIQSRVAKLEREPDAVLEDAMKFVAPVGKLFEQARQELTRMDEAVPIREQTMSDEEKTFFRQDRQRLHERMLDLEKGEVGFDVSVAKLEKLKNELSPETRAETVRGLVAWVQDFLQVSERVTLVPAQARLEVITIDPISLDSRDAFRIALTHRLDFMNGRSALVDQWRQIQVRADALQSVLNLTASGDVRTSKDNPVSFRAPAANMRLGLEFDAPLTRLLERNEYRESLISYQQRRREFIQSRDNLEKGLRALLRTLEQRRQQLQIQRRAVAIAMRRVDETQLSLNEPPPQLQPGQRALISPTTAFNLLDAQRSLQGTQNSFLAAWLNYHSTRLRLYRELGIMRLDEEGRWVETPLVELILQLDSQEPGFALPLPMPPEIPEDVLDAINSYESSYESGSTPPVPMNEAAPDAAPPIPAPDPSAGAIDRSYGLVRPVSATEIWSAKQRVSQIPVSPAWPQSPELTGHTPSSGWRATKPANDPN